jgi:hypothetical protein
MEDDVSKLVTDRIRRSINFEKWLHKTDLQKDLVELTISSAKQRMSLIDEELGSSIIRGDVLLPDEALTTPVKKVMRKEELRMPDSPSEDSDDKEWNHRYAYQVDLCHELQNGQVKCLECMTGVGCEWDGPFGELLRARAMLIKMHHPTCGNKKIRFALYSYYVSKRYGRRIAQLKKENKEPRVPLPLCVETEIKNKYSDAPPSHYVGFKRQKTEQK